MNYLHELLTSVDVFLFHQINHVWTSSWLDAVLPVLTDLHKVKFFVFIALPAIIFLWLLAQGWKALKVLVALALVVAASDLTCHRLIKPAIGRLRPDKVGIEVILRRPTQYGYSFPSNHASNAFAAAAFLSSVYPMLKIPFFVFAGVIAYSRVYVGVHYPFDVIGGALVGFLIGWLSSKILKPFI